MHSHNSYSFFHILRDSNLIPFDNIRALYCNLPKLNINFLTNEIMIYNLGGPHHTTLFEWISSLNNILLIFCNYRYSYEKIPNLSNFLHNYRFLIPNIHVLFLMLFDSTLPLFDNFPFHNTKILDY